MKIYRLDFDVDNYKSIHLCEDVDADFYRMFDGTSRIAGWTFPEVMDDEEDEALKHGDAPGFNIPVFNKKALDVLLPLIKDDVEVLPFKYGDDQLYGINVLTILDAIDYENSEYKTFRDGKRIMAFSKYSFKEEAINTNIFKIVDFKRGEIFVSETFYNYVLNNKLEGFELELVYKTRIQRN